MIATSGPTTLWYLSRGTGVVSLLLLTAALVLGVAGSLRARPRVLLAGLHRSASAARDRLRHRARADDGCRRLCADRREGRDPPVPLSVPPGVARARNGRLRPPARARRDEPAAGTDRAARLARRPLARLSVVAVALVHGLGTGTDGKSGWLLVLTVALHARRRRRRRAAGGADPGIEGRRRLVALGAVPAVLLVLFIWAKTGPLQRGWALRAGTPASLIPAAAHGARDHWEEGDRDGAATRSGDAASLHRNRLRLAHAGAAELLGHRHRADRRAHVRPDRGQAAGDALRRPARKWRPLDAEQRRRLRHGGQPGCLPRAGRRARGHPHHRRRRRRGRESTSASTSTCGSTPPPAR